MSESDAQLVARAKAGELPAVEALVRRHLRTACAVALAVLGNRSDADDLAQESLLVALERLESCREPEKFKGWLSQIVRNRALNARGAAAAKRRVDEAGAPSATVADATAEAERVFLRDRLLAALAQLGANQREVVVLHDLEGWTHGEIALLLSLSEVNARQLLFTARRKLREILEPPTASASDNRP